MPRKLTDAIATLFVVIATGLIFGVIGLDSGYRLGKEAVRAASKQQPPCPCPCPCPE